MGKPHLVVDGSNIATEGRSMPSLQQLLDAVDAVSKEFDFDNTTVIVDSTFGHRIDKKEKDAYEERVNSAQIITPPAGVIGRGDAFILEVADRADAVVLSNDSFQEFHGKYDWLFEEGRLLGGKHVPGVGWIFLARSPVRGPTSRKAISDAKRKRRGGSKKAATKAPAKKARGASKKKAASKPTKKAASADRSPRKSGGKEPEPYNEPLPFIEFVGAHPIGSVVEGEVEQFSSHGAYVMVDGTRCYIALKSISEPPPRSAKEVLTLGETRRFSVLAIDTPRRGIDLGIPEGEVLTPVADAGGETSGDDADGDDTGATAEQSSGGRSRRRGRGRGRGASTAPEEAPETSEEDKPETPAEATPAELADQTPASDKKLSVSQRRKLRAQRAAAEADEADDTPGETMAKKAAKKSTAKKRTAKKAAAKKATTKKAAPRKSTAKKAPAKKSAAKKTTAKKTTAKKATARKAPAKKSAAKKTTAKKSTAKKAPAKRAATKKAPAKKAVAKKAPAKKKSAAKRAPAKKRATKKAAPRKRT